MFNARVSVISAPMIPGPYGGLIRDWDHPVIRAVPYGVELQPGGRMEDSDNGTRVFVQSGWRLITPPGRYLAVLATDRIRVSGRDGDLAVVGDGSDWAHDAVGHTELELEAIHG